MMGKQLHRKAKYNWVWILWWKQWRETLTNALPVGPTVNLGMIGRWSWSIRQRNIRPITNHSHHSSQWSTNVKWITCKEGGLSPNIQPCRLAEDFQLLQEGCLMMKMVWVDGKGLSHYEMIWLKTSYSCKKLCHNEDDLGENFLLLQEGCFIMKTSNFYKRLGEDW